MDVRDQYAYLKPQPLVWLAILGSTAFHGLLVLALVVGGLMEENRKPLKQRALMTRILKKGKKKPKNQLPHKKVVAPPVATAPKAIPTPHAEKTPAKASKPAPKTPRRKDYSNSMGDALRSIAKKSDYENDGDPEGSDDGDSLIAQKGEIYQTQVYKAVKSKYSVPELITKQERMFLNATVVITLTSSGQIKDLDFEKRSGKDLFDSAIEAAIRRAAPFPKPPAELAGQYASIGIGLIFHARKM
ncbi:MAG: TonB family protein [Deltaproteobacteria bacterium]|nr:TonB family protein [Deltaproteobacteria bacterium]